MDSRAQADREAVRQAVLEYVEGVYEANPGRVARCVHPDLAKRGFFVTANDTTESIMTFAQLLDLARNYRQDNQDAPKEVVLFEVLDQTASVKLIAAWGIDYMHLAKYHGQWLIVHVLWQTQPHT